MYQRRIIHSRRRRDQTGTKSSKTPSDTLMVCGQVEVVTSPPLDNPFCSLSLSAQRDL